MLPQDLCFDAKQSLGDTLILVGVRKVYAYKDNRRTEETKGFKYEILLKDKNYERVDVMIKGEKPLINYTNEQMEVEFEGLQAKIYVFDKKVKIFFYADFVRPKNTK